MGALDGKGGIWVAAVLLIVAAAVFLMFNRSQRVHIPGGNYFIDEETGEESVHPLSDAPPLLGKSGKPTVVREYKYSLDGGSTVKIGYYMKYDEATKKKVDEAVAAGKGAGDVNTIDGTLVRSPVPGSKWVRAASEEGANVMKVDVPPGKEASLMVIYP